MHEQQSVVGMTHKNFGKRQETKLPRPGIYTEYLYVPMNMCVCHIKWACSLRSLVVREREGERE